MVTEASASARCRPAEGTNPSNRSYTRPQVLARRTGCPPTRGRIGRPMGGVLAPPESLSWMLVGRVDGAGTESRALHVPQVLAAVLRRGLPNLVEATIVPTVLFIVIVALVGPGAAMVAVLVRGYGAIGRRLVFHQRIPALLMLATLGLTIRTVVGLASGSTFAYFVQPLATTVAL